VNKGKKRKGAQDGQRYDPGAIEDPPQDAGEDEEDHADRKGGRVPDADPPSSLAA
jgi:hypothetical protein